MHHMASIRQDIKFYGLDISKSLINMARELNPNASFVCGNALEGIPFDEKFDRIVSFSVAQYFPHSDFVQLNQLCVDSLGTRERGVIHCSIPDISKKLPIAINEQFERYGSIFAVLRGIAVYLLKMRGNIYGHDGSFWHDAEKLRRDYRVEIKRPSDSWYRFDLLITKR